MKEIEVVSRSLHVRLQPVGVEGPSDFDNAFSAITRERTNGLITLAAPMFDEQRTRIINFAVKNRLPAISPGGNLRRLAASWLTDRVSSISTAALPLMWIKF